MMQMVPRLKKVEKYLSEKGYKNLYTYDVKKSATEVKNYPMVQYQKTIKHTEVL